MLEIIRRRLKTAFELPPLPPDPPYESEGQIAAEARMKRMRDESDSGMARVTRRETVAQGGGRPNGSIQDA